MASPMSIRPKENGVTLSWRNGPSLSGITAAAHYSLGQETFTLRLTEPDQTLGAYGLQATWHWEPSDDGADIWLEATNTGRDTIRLGALDVLAILAALGGDCHLPTLSDRWVFYQNGWQSSTPSLARNLRDSLYTDPGTHDYRRAHQPHWDVTRGDDPSSEWVTVIHAPSPAADLDALLLGFVSTKDQLSEIRLDLKGTAFTGLTTRCHLDQTPLGPGKTVCSERLWVRAGADPTVLLEMWAARAGEEMEARVPATPPVGWCTWHCFAGENTAGDIQANMDALVRHRLPLNLLILDDGYQTAVGDWLSPDASRFPDGIEPLAATIRSAGHTPAVWVAPFGAGKDSQIYADDPDWVLQNGDGEPVLAWRHRDVDCYALDCTHPAVLDWLKYTFWRMRSEWGVVFFKLDHLFAAALPGRRHDRTTTRAQALRKGLEAVRAGVGDDAFLLASGAPLGPCIGIVDGMRVGPDVDPNWHPFWSHNLAMPSTESALRNALTRAPFNNRLWANDPGCLMVRERGTELDLVLNEMRTLTALVALLGGTAIDSDHLPGIKPGRLKYLRQALPPTGTPGRPADVFEHEMPRLLLLPIERDWGRWWVAAVVNWWDRTTETTVRLADLGLPAGRYHVYHYWRRRYLGTTDDVVTIPRHQRHETAVLLFKPVSDHPALLTTTFHVCQTQMEVADCTWRADDGTLRVELQKPGSQFGDLLFAAPEPWQAVEARIDTIKRPLKKLTPGITRLGLTLKEEAIIEIRYEEKNDPKG